MSKSKSRTSLNMGTFSLGADRDIAAVKNDLDAMEDLINKISLDSNPGSDDALDAGYDPSVPNQISTIALECQSIAARVEECDKQISLKLQALKDYEEAIPSTRDEDDKEAESEAYQRAAVQVLTFLVNSPTDFQTFFQGMGIPMTDEFIDALRRAATQASASQANRWIEVANRSAQVQSLEGQLSAKETELNRATRDVSIQKDLVREMTTRRDDLKALLTASEKLVTHKDNELSQARAQARKCNEKILEVQKLNAEAEEKIALREEELRQKTEAVSAAEANARQHSRQTAELKREVEQATSDKTDKVLENERLTARLTTLTREYAAETAKMEAQAEIQGKATNDAKAKLDDALGSLSESRRLMGQNKEQVRNLSFQVTDLELKLKVSTENIETKDRLLSEKSTTITERDETIAGLNARIFSLQSRLENSDVESRRLITEKESQAATITERDEIIIGLNAHINELKNRLDDSKNESNRLITEKESQAATIVDRDDTIAGLNARISGLQSDLDNSNNKTDWLATEKANQTTTIAGLNDEIADLKSRLEGSNGQAHSLTAENEKQIGIIAQRDGAISALKTQVANLESKLKGSGDVANKLIIEKDRQLKEHNESLAERDSKLEIQVQNASVVLRDLSFDVDSPMWRAVAEKTLSGSTRVSATGDQWQPWRICASWSADESLAINDDRRTRDAIALATLATLKTDSGVTELLSMLQALQDSMVGSPSMLTTITELLLESLMEAVGDSRLHFMHRVSICQVGSLLASSAEAFHPLLRTIDAADSRVTRLIQALKARDVDPSTQIANSVMYGDVSLVGLERDPPGVIALQLKDRQIWWIDISRIQTTAGMMEISGAGDAITQLPLDSTERVLWSFAHT
ncbi:hypothetical protein F53441_10104 [Fusarium austroafricanum]|uniref:Uncharacterized protein n=1 Tax=Fusarium austroafricanum TaxID=2364996 RepID=A0A8H4NPK2_9HYPO|nr:hypothetical protein F53441_10104 [Fusarium austroafricanum]